MSDEWRLEKENVTERKKNTDTRLVDADYSLTSHVTLSCASAIAIADVAFRSERIFGNRHGYAIRHIPVPHYFSCRGTGL